MSAESLNLPAPRQKKDPAQEAMADALNTIMSEQAKPLDWRGSTLLSSLGPRPKQTTPAEMVDRRFPTQEEQQQSPEGKFRNTPTRDQFLRERGIKPPPEEVPLQYEWPTGLIKGSA